MALRYAIQIDNGAIQRVEPTKVVPRYQAPSAVEFRPNANMASVVQDVLCHERVQLSAAVGAGKSVRVPEAIAKETKRLVVHCVPSDLLAYNLYQYVTTVVSVPCAFVGPEVVALPEKGIAFMGGATLVSLLLRQRCTGEKLPSFCLFLDECHESDCFTHVIRDLAMTFEFVTNLVLSSATFDPSGGRKPEPAGVRRDCELPDVNVTDWDPDDIAMPWSTTTLDADALVYVERRSVVDKMAVSYAESGYDVKRLHSRMSVDEFARVIESLKARNRVATVLLADYSFRSGHTFPSVRYLVDSGEVRYYGLHEGLPMKMYRPTYQFEGVQTAGRAGRVPGTTVKVWSPKGREMLMCDLEGCEVDAAALLYRMFGFKPPKSFSGCRFYSGDVPDDLAEAFASAMPLFAWPETRLTPWVGGLVEPVRPAIHCEPVSRPVSGVGRPSLKVRSSIDGKLRDLSSAETLGVGLRPITRNKPLVDISRPVSPVLLNGDENDGDHRVGSLIDAHPPSLAELPTTTRPMVARVEKVVESPLTDGPGTPMREVASFPAELGLCDLFTEAVGWGSGQVVDIKPGDYCYYPGVEKALDPSMVFHGGVEAVHRMVKKQVVVDGWDYTHRLIAVRLLLEEYNMSIARYKAVERIAVSLPNVQHTVKSLIDPVVFTDWLRGLSEQAVQDRAVSVSSYEDLLRVLPRGLIRATGELAAVYHNHECDYLRMYVQQLEMVAGEHDPASIAGYAEIVSRPPERSLLLGSTKQKSLMPSEHSRYKSEIRVMEPASSRELVASGQKQHRTVAKYKLAPSSGLPSLVARAIVKAVGKGDMKVVVD